MIDRFHTTSKAEPDTAGEFVRYEDYAGLEAGFTETVAELTARIARGKQTEVSLEAARSATNEALDQAVAQVSGLKSQLTASVNEIAIATQRISVAEAERDAELELSATAALLEIELRGRVATLETHLRSIEISVASALPPVPKTSLEQLVDEFVAKLKG